MKKKMMKMNYYLMKNLAFFQQNAQYLKCLLKTPLHKACKKKVYKSSLHPDYEFLHHSRYKKFRDHITDALEYFNNIRNEEKEILDFAE
ncbi:hypothetical protein PFFCH_03551 [Plasmodium falciparum FCH/4]|uniref:Uncharacterized protein n=1 Tax=Plasmodium falciparum FCH/4 TaxID=1036724 RepID=A0A024VLE5_PLAFA|nr:hypothetical protein PFFCH_03551 [Plasmodium falciparum FCH/4]